MFTDLPCGCESRKEIMFRHGAPGMVEAIILGAPTGILIYLWLRKLTNS